MPPSRPGLSVVIGVGKPKSRPPSYGTPDGADPSPDSGAGADAPQQDMTGGKSSPEAAACFGPDLKCASCTHYQPGDHPDLGTCEKVDGSSFGPAGDIVGCVKFFEPGGGEGTDETGGQMPGGMTGAGPGSAPQGASGGY